ncbi:MAG: hypothetical protein EKK40_04465 [Bradyrhizobiaceae bacterium]|nr:MAG: hypothetical protein EKK40_04465 [Bradyrhizobiaceae bacterium]
MKTPHYIAATVFAVALQAAVPALAQDAPVRRPFTSTLSNNVPLAFGMDTSEASRALGGLPLTYVSGRPGDELFMVVQPVNGDGFMWRNDPLYLQFRRGRLTGWKGDWSRGWMWRSPFG